MVINANRSARSFHLRRNLGGLTAGRDNSRRFASIKSNCWSSRIIGTR